jgi:dihydroorotase
MVDLWLKDCKIVPENSIISIGLAKGKIVSLKKIAPRREECINLRDKVILPGLIDCHVHFRDPGLTYKENFRTGTMAAACGGFTTVMDMPNTKPATNTTRAFKEKLRIAEHKSLVNFALHAGVGRLKDIEGVNKLNPASFKIFMDLLSDHELEEIFAAIGKIGDKKNHITLHCEDKEIVEKYTQKYQDKGKINSEIYADARPPLAETVAVNKAVHLARKYDLKIHICHITLLETLDIIKEAGKLGVQVTSEITPHHLLLNSSYLQKCGNLAKTNPPLRSGDVKLDLNNLDRIDAISTDHAPHTTAEKEENIWNAPPGIPNLETTLPLLLTQINENNLSFNQLKNLLCDKPADIFHLEGKGHIEMGADADLVVVDMKKEEVINPSQFKSKAKYSPFKGFKIKGMPVLTLCGGEIVMEEGEVFKNQGEFVYKKDRYIG